MRLLKQMALRPPQQTERPTSHVHLLRYFHYLDCLTDCPGLVVHHLGDQHPIRIEDTLPNSVIIGQSLSQRRRRRLG